MMIPGINPSVLLPLGCSLLLVMAIAFQLVTLIVVSWGEFYAQVPSGYIYENGQFGLWKLCSVRAPQYLVVCDPKQTFFKIGIYALVTGVLASCHLFILCSLLVVFLVRLYQILQNDEDSYLFYVSPIVLSWIRTALTAVAAALCLATLVFALYIANAPGFYTVQPDWAYWLQVFIFLIDLIILLFCVWDNVQLNQQCKSNAMNIQQQRPSQDSTNSNGTDYSSSAYSNPTETDYNPQPNPTTRQAEQSTFNPQPNLGMPSAHFSPVPNNYANADIRSSSIASTVPTTHGMPPASGTIQETPRPSRPSISVPSGMPQPFMLPGMTDNKFTRRRSSIEENSENSSSEHEQPINASVPNYPSQPPTSTGGIPPPPPPPPPPPGAVNVTINTNIPPPPPMPGMSAPSGMAPQYGVPHSTSDRKNTTAPKPAKRKHSPAISYAGRTVISIHSEGKYQNPIYETS